MFNYVYVQTFIGGCYPNNLTLRATKQCTSSSACVTYQVSSKYVPPIVFSGINHELFASDQSSILRTQREKLTWYGNLLGTENVHHSLYVKTCS